MVQCVVNIQRLFWLFKSNWRSW